MAIWGSPLTDSDLPSSDLTQIEIDFLFALLRDEQITEEDAELVLSLIREIGSNELEHLENIIVRFPNLIKNVYTFSSHISNTGLLCEILLKIVSNQADLTEYQLFWIACIAENFLKSMIKDSAYPSVAKIYSGLGTQAG